MPPLRSLASIGIALAALAGPASAGPADRSAIGLGIVVEERASPGARCLAQAIAEADGIWRPHGVAVRLAGARDVAPDDIRLTLTFEPASFKPGRERGLGSIWFDEKGSPEDVLAVDLAAVAARIKPTRFGGRAFEQWPPALADLMIGRALGRVLAHEIGHYVLASPAHASRGLMRAAFNGIELAGWDRRQFELDAGALPRLRARLARLEARHEPLAAVRP